VGTDNFKDALMRRLADHGNGTYHYLDSFEEAQRVLLEQMNATFVTVARDAKAQVEFNPAKVVAWRLLGYEKRLLPHQDFNDDTKDAGEIGAGHSVTIFYEIVPAGAEIPTTGDSLKYQRTPEPARPDRALVASPDLLTLKLRYQRPEGSASRLVEIPVVDEGREFRQAPEDFRFAAAVAAFGMSLRTRPPATAPSLDLVLRLARENMGADPQGWRAEFVSLVEKVRQLTGGSGRSPRPAPFE
jgi:secreted protein with Ig-like and vWFA domain